MSKNYKEHLTDAEKCLTPDTTLFDTIGRAPKTKFEKVVFYSNKQCGSKIYSTKYSYQGLNGTKLNNKRNVKPANRAVKKQYKQRLKRELQKELNDSVCQQNPDNKV